MNSTLKENEVQILTYLLTQLEKRIYLLRISLYGSVDKYFPDGPLVSKERLGMEEEDFQKKYKLSAEDYRLMVDSCDIETCIRRILDELTTMKSCTCLKEIVKELDYERTSFKKHQKILEEKRKQMDQLKEVLLIIQEQAQITVKRLKLSKFDTKDKAQEKADSSGELDFLKRLMDYKVESKKNFYAHKQAELEEIIESFEREVRTQMKADGQTISFWLLKYDEYTEKLDFLLKQMFDNWSVKRRELEILKKYRKLNQKKIQKLHKLISERENYLEKYRIEREMQQKKREEELKIQAAAIKIQAFWRGTMVRKHLGPFKIKKSKKGKGKGKGKGKKKK